jgi:hypothetical protein
LRVECLATERSDTIRQHEAEGWKWFAVDILPKGRERVTLFRKSNP